MGIDLKKAIFFDRDGTLNEEVFYTDTAAFESPRNVADVALLPGVGRALKNFQDSGFLLFIVSNQPNAAKGKNTREELIAVHNALMNQLEEDGVVITESFYCFHHPDFTGPCDCRKPSPFFLLEAQKKYDIDMARCWMIGDRQSDIECGQRAGVKTLLVDKENSLVKSAHKMLSH